MKKDKRKFDSWGRLVNVKPFKVKIPGVLSGLGIWPAGMGFGEATRAAWLDTLKLYQLRALQDRIGAWRQQAHDTAEHSEAMRPKMNDAMNAMDKDLDLVAEAINRWQDRHPEEGAEYLGI